MSVDSTSPCPVQRLYEVNAVVPSGPLPAGVSSPSYGTRPANLSSSDMQGKGPEAIQAIHWYALYVRSNCEKLVEDRLNLGTEAEAYWPSYTVVRELRGKKVTLHRSLLPGYVFARFDIEHRISLMMLPQVVHILGSDHPLPISDAEVQAVRQLAAAPPDQRLVVEPSEIVADGQQIEVVKGPHWLRGLKGVVAYHKNRTRIVISVGLLNQQISTEVDAGWLRAVAA